MFSKGFTRNGHDVLEFSYRNMLQQLSPVQSKNWAARIAKKKTDRLLVELARNHRPDLIMITAFKLLDGRTVQALKEALPGARVICWYGDMRKGVDPKVGDIARHCEWFLATSAGETLRNYKALGVAHCAFLPNPTDRDIERVNQTGAQWHSKIVFVGKLRHKQPGQDPLRWELIQHLKQREGLTVWGALGQPALKGLEYLYAICGADMVLSINAFNDVRMYHSDRLIHSLGCGAFVLARRVPDGELLFEDKKHLCYFGSLEECVELINRFSGDAAARQALGAAGMARAHEGFGCEKLTRHIVSLLETGRYQEDWAEII